MGGDLPPRQRQERRPLCPDCAPARLYAEAGRACAVAGVDLAGLEAKARTLIAELNDDDHALYLSEQSHAAADALTAVLWPREGK